MKKNITWLLLGFILAFSVNVYGAEVTSQLVKVFDSTNGGRIEIQDKDKNLDATLGSESGVDENVGGTLVLYNKGRRVALGTSKETDSGLFNLHDGKGIVRVSAKADDVNTGPVIFITDSQGKVKTYFTEKKGFIDGKEIATKEDVKKMIEEALK